MSVLDNAKGNLFERHEARWNDDSFGKTGPNRLTQFHGEPSQDGIMRGIPTAAIYDFVKPQTVANTPGRTQSSQRRQQYDLADFVMETLGKEPAKLDLLRFDKGNIDDITHYRTGVQFSDLPKVRSEYESGLGIPPFSEFNPVSNAILSHAAHPCPIIRCG